MWDRLSIVLVDFFDLGLKNVQVSACTSLDFVFQYVFVALSFLWPFNKISGAPVVFGISQMYSNMLRLLYSTVTFLCVINALHLKRFTFILIMLILIIHVCRCQKIDQQGNFMVCPTVPSKCGQNHWSSSYWGKSLYVSEHIVFSLKALEHSIRINSNFSTCLYVVTYFPWWLFS